MITVTLIFPPLLLSLTFQQKYQDAGETTKTRMKAEKSGDIYGICVLYSPQYMLTYIHVNTHIYIHINKYVLEAKQVEKKTLCKLYERIVSSHYLPCDV